MNKITRPTVNIPENEYAALKDLASESNITVTQALRQAISHETFLAEKVKEESVVVIRDPKTKTSQELVFSFPGQSTRL